MQDILLSPPAAFIIILGLSFALAGLASRISFKPKKSAADIGKSYACGEETPTTLIQPDYTQFFPFAFFFTILHVVTLMLATAPINTIQSFAIAVIYVLGAVVSLIILFKR